MARTGCLETRDQLGARARGDTQDHRDQADKW